MFSASTATTPAFVPALIPMAGAGFFWTAGAFKYPLLQDILVFSLVLFGGGRLRTLYRCLSETGF